MTPSSNDPCSPLQINAKDILYDLGCGDARLLIEAAKSSGARGGTYMVLLLFRDFVLFLCRKVIRILKNICELVPGFKAPIARV